MLEKAKKRRMGRPTVPPRVSRNLREALWYVLEKHCKNNKAELGRRIHRCPSAVQELLQGTHSATLDTVTRLALLLEVTEAELLSGSWRPPGATRDPYPNLTRVLDRLSGLLHPETVELAHRMAKRRGDKDQVEWLDYLAAGNVRTTFPRESARG